METGSSIVILFRDHEKRYQFIVVPIWLDYGNENDCSSKRQVATIAIKDNHKQVYVLHGLTEFIIGYQSYWRSKKFNTQRKHANNIVQFLNYLIHNRNKLHIKKLSDIDIMIGTNYLNHLTDRGIKKDTVIDARRTLTYFYLWLYKQGCLPKVNNEIFESKKKVNERGSLYYESIFNETLPSYTPIRKEHIFPIKYIPLLFEIATLYAHPIVLGLYLQIFGGLRAGEVVNLSRTQFKKRVSQGDFLLHIKKRNYRTDVKDLSGLDNVKKPRYQLILKTKDWADILYRDHIDFYHRKDTSGSGALFINRDGKPMTGKSYHQYFYKVKRIFLEFLNSFGSAEDKLIANHLRNTNWGTHIGRGTFTNLIAEETENILEIAFLRGDSSPLSSLPYTAKTERVRRKLEQRLSETHNEYIPRLVILNDDKNYEGE